MSVRAAQRLAHRNCVQNRITNPRRAWRGVISRVPSVCRTRTGEADNWPVGKQRDERSTQPPFSPTDPRTATDLSATCQLRSPFRSSAEASEFLEERGSRIQAREGKTLRVVVRNDGKVKWLATCGLLSHHGTHASSCPKPSRQAFSINYRNSEASRRVGSRHNLPIQVPLELAPDLCKH